MIYLQLFLNFLKIGAFTFGGAYGAIPIIRETVLANGWLTEEQFSYFLAVSESTPGPIMVNMATYIGFEKAGVLGSALCTLGTILPAYIVMILITSVLRRAINHPRVRAVLAAVVPCVTGVILATGAYMTYEAIFSQGPENSTAFDLCALLIGIILVAGMAVWKRLRKKPMSPILLIGIAAVLGMLFYGLQTKPYKEEPMLTIEHLTKCYDGRAAVDDLSLHIAKGEIFGFIGHNGAGKTTTLKSVAGILPFDRGEIRIDGIPLASDPLACKARMAYLPDNPDLYEFMSGIKYLHFIADIFGVGPERNERIASLSDAFSFTEHLSKPISALSHGMKQKVALISAFLHEPKLILLDEPFVGLDPRASHTLKEMMRAHCDRGGAIFFSTHVLDTAEKLCDKIAIIKGGRLLVTGTMAEVRGNVSLEEVFLELSGGGEDE